MPKPSGGSAEPPAPDASETTTVNSSASASILLPTSSGPGQGSRAPMMLAARSLIAWAMVSQPTSTCMAGIWRPVRQLRRAGPAEQDRKSLRPKCRQRLAT
jgi:hypothetical protein